MKCFKLAINCILLSVTLSLAGLAQKPVAKRSERLNPPESALNVITADGVMSHIKTLASDEFEGRGPRTHGEDLAINYIADQFRKIGLAPGSTDGTYFQKVPLVGITTKQDAEMKIKAAGKDLKLKFGTDFVARTVRVTEKTGFDADMVFVGYGVVARDSRVCGPCV